MKQCYYFLAAMAAVTLGSCSNEEIGERNILPDENGRTPIAITTYLPQTTRGYNAQEATISSLSNSGGGFTIHAVNTTDHSTVINGWTYVASGDGSSSPANNSLMAYWPDDNSKVNFYAYYPADGASLAASCTPDVESGTLAITTDGTKDVMAAYASTSKDDNNGRVSLQFRHLMAQTVINVLANATNMPDGTTHTLTGLTLSAPGAATLTFSSGEVVANADAAATYAFHSATADNPVELSADATTVGTAMIPASTGTGTKAQLTVDYSATINGNTRTYSRTAEVTLISGFKNQINVSVQGDMPLTVKAVVENMEPIVDGHVYVDLGLPSGLLWATMNVGASKPEEYGNYFAWGETEPYYSVVGNDTIWKDGYSDGYVWDNYKYCSSDEYMTKYVHDDRYGTIDNKWTLESDDDAATVNWGGSWRMPTNDELAELLNAAYCTQEATTVNGVSGRKFTSVSNGNSIFFPFAGSIEGTYFRLLGTDGDSWTSSLASADTKEANCFSFWNASANNYTISSRYIGMPVRAVHPAE
ncbi:MAG: fimbrillin family protein [Bacteroidales bacterium]|nr:fimbrillin family protein [Bacteroidales bacterium]